MEQDGNGMGIASILETRKQSLKKEQQKEFLNNYQGQIHYTAKKESLIRNRE